MVAGILIHSLLLFLPRGYFFNKGVLDNPVNRIYSRTFFYTAYQWKRFKSQRTITVLGVFLVYLYWFFMALFIMSLTAVLVIGKPLL